MTVPIVEVTTPLALPVTTISREEHLAPPDPGSGLCLSGGGYRAMLFHTGVVWRLHELGLLPRMKRISSVSGGSILAGQVALQWRTLHEGSKPAVSRYVERVANPIRRLASTTIDVPAVLRGVVLPGTISDRIVAAYSKHLFGNATLADLPADEDGPRFVINALNMQSGALWRFSRPFMRDYRVGEVRRP